MTLALACTWGLASILLPGIATSNSGAVAPLHPVTRAEASQAKLIRFVYPVPGSTVTWAFTEGRDPFTGEVRHHRGVDLAAPLGTPILAPAAGVVQLATEHYDKELARISHQVS